MEKVWFSEEQKFTQKWVIWILFGALLAVGASIVFKVKSGSPHLDQSLLILVLSTMVISGIGYAFVIARLLTYVTDKGIRYQFFPIHGKTRLIQWNKITKVEVRKYNAIKEYGGWGIRFSTKGRALIASGEYGLQLTYKNGKKLLLGTNNPAALKSVIQQRVPHLA